MPDGGPGFSLSVNGQPITGVVRDNLVSMKLTESVEDTAKLTFAGYGSELVQVFDGEIVDIGPVYSEEDSSVLEVVALDRSYLLKRKPIPFIFTGDKFDNMKDVAEYIVNKHGLSFTLNPQKKLLDYKLEDDQGIEQTNETDWEILTKLARTGNYKLFVRGNTVYMVDIDWLVGSQTIPFIFEHRPSEINIEYDVVVPLKEFKAKLGSKGQRDKVMVISWTSVGSDPESKEEATDPDTDGDVGYTDIKFQSNTIETIRVKGPVTSKAQARAYAKAELQRRADLAVQGEALISGEPRLMFGQIHMVKVWDLDRFGKQYSGHYYIKEVTHVLDADEGFTTAFKVTRRGLSKN
jgi:phage protein D